MFREQGYHLLVCLWCGCSLAAFLGCKFVDLCLLKKTRELAKARLVSALLEALGIVSHEIKFECGQRPAGGEGEPRAAGGSAPLG